MPQVPYPIDVDPYVEAAQAVACKVAQQVPLACAILDDWHSGSNKKGARIVYGLASDVGCCEECGLCPLFQFVGEDSDEEKEGLHTSLCLTPPNFLELFASSEHKLLLRQKYLNCKTLVQYEIAYILFIMECCITEEELDAELEWVMGFRLLHLDQVTDLESLRCKEMESKKRILFSVQQQLLQRDDHRLVYVQAFIARQNFE